MTEWLGLPALASAHGASIDELVGLIHIMMAILFVGWGGFFVFALARFRKSRNPVADYKGVTSHTSTYLEIGVAVAEGVLLFGFSVPMWIQRVDKVPAASEAVVVDVTAEQFAWNIHYPGPDGKFGRTDPSLIDMQTNPLGLDRKDEAAKDDIITLNQLRLPVGKPAVIRLRSKDVIHGFNLPEFRIKQDVIPGLTIPVWFKPTTTTDEMRTRLGKPEFTYEIACAQLCGLGHYKMRGFLTVDTPDEFQKWMDDEEAKLKEEGDNSGWN
jgi:cytochrome c oxidase subunit 2